MAESWADWNRGMDEAYACLQPRAGMPKQYYEGYYYACALDFEGIAATPPGAIAEDQGAEPVLSYCTGESETSVQLQRLATRLSTGAGPSPVTPEPPNALPARGASTKPCA